MQVKYVAFVIRERSSFIQSRRIDQVKSRKRNTAEPVAWRAVLLAVRFHPLQFNFMRRLVNCFTVLDKCEPRALTECRNLRSDVIAGRSWLRNEWA